MIFERKKDNKFVYLVHIKIIIIIKSRVVSGT
jgi:hypothetical protein